jgi:type 1 glutamine amidotransferase
MRLNVLGVLVVLAIGLACVSQASATEPPVQGRIRALVTVGGHGYDEKVFAAKFGKMPDLQYTQIRMPQEADILKPGLEEKYDVIVMFDWAKTSDEENRAFAGLLKRGIGLVSMHANLLSHEGWSEWRRVVGCQWCFKEQEIDGKKYGPTQIAGYTVPIKVTAADKQHPMTRGLADFTVADEAFKNGYVDPGVHVLLTTDCPTCQRQVAFTQQYGKCRVFYCMLGHGSETWNNPAFTDLLDRAIRWAAGRDTPKGTP